MKKKSEVDSVGFEPDSNQNSADIVAGFGVEVVNNNSSNWLINFYCAEQLSDGTTKMNEAICAAAPFYLTECINQMLRESQLPHKTVNSLFTITCSNDEVTILWRN